MEPSPPRSQPTDAGAEGAVTDEVDDSGVAARAVLVESLVHGSDLIDATVAAVRALLDDDDGPRARALALALQREGAVEPGRLGAAIVAHSRGWHALALDCFRQVDERLVARHALLGLLESALAEGDETAVAQALRCVEYVGDADLVAVAARLMSAGRRDDAREVLARLGPQAREALDEDVDKVATILEEHLYGGEVEVPDGAVAIGVLDYRQPDAWRASYNLGDPVQTLAMLGHIVRYSNVELTGDDGLGELATELTSEVPERLRRPEPRGRAHLVPVFRDDSSAQRLPSPLWTLAFGWHMHSQFGLSYDFPYHPGVRPIFVSFHLNRPEMLTEEAIDYLRRYGPVGCRDWSTVYLLRAAGVPAFFSGCLTTTVDGVVSEVPRPGPDAPVCLVDPLPRVRRRMSVDGEEYTHRADDLRCEPVSVGVRAAHARLRRYASRHRRMVTSRLHAYLPATALGIRARLVPRNRADPRYAGLEGLTPRSESLRAMQHRLRTLVDGVLSLIMAGEDEAVVYDHWRSMTEPLVAEAATAHEAVDRIPLPHVDVASLVAPVLASKEIRGPEVPPGVALDVAFSLDQNLAEQLPVTLDAVVARSSVPVRAWVMTRGLDASYRSWIAAAFPHVGLGFLPCDDVEYADVHRLFPHITTSTMDRLLLPAVLPEVERLLYLDIDALAVADAASLRELDLGGNGFAARTTHRWGHLFAWRASMRLSAEKANELRQRVTRLHSFTFPALNAGVLVMDLAQMRAEDFTERCLGWVERYGLNDQDVLMAVAGPRRTELPPQWNAWPLMEPLSDPAVLHYLGGAKPWGDLVVPSGDEWRRQAAAAPASDETIPR